MENEICLECGVVQDENYDNDYDEMCDVCYRKNTCIGCDVCVGIDNLYIRPMDLYREEKSMYCMDCIEYEDRQYECVCCGQVGFSNLIVTPETIDSDELYCENCEYNDRFDCEYNDIIDCDNQVEYDASIKC